MDYSDSRFSFRPVIFLGPLFARSFSFSLVLSLSLSLSLALALSASLQSKERYRCLEKGFQMEVMVIPKLPFQMWLKFRRNQQRFITQRVMTHWNPVTNSASPPPSQLFFITRTGRGCILGFCMQTHNTFIRPFNDVFAIRERSILNILRNLYFNERQLMILRRWKTVEFYAFVGNLKMVLVVIFTV